MSRKIKQLVVQELAEKFRDMPRLGCVLMDYKGLEAVPMATIRRALDERGGSLTIVKNTLFIRALEQIGSSPLRTLVNGPTAVLFARDCMDATRMATEIAQQYEAVSVRGGYIEGEVVGPARIEYLSKLPSRQVLLSRALYGLSAPLSRFANCLNSLLHQFASVLVQLKEKKEKEER